MGVDMKKNLSRTLSNKKGTASVETVTLLVIIIGLVYYSFGFFGVIHTGIVSNIHSRTYVFETVRHRANYMYFRSNRPLEPARKHHYYNVASRLHGIQHEREEASPGSGHIPVERPIAMGFELEEEGRDTTIHSEDIRRIATGDRNADLGVNPVWITILYGLCYNAGCTRR